ncbi:N-acetyldiaminopimelate deacetylase [Alicyclobacillus fastidiosus]|uniref:N-acetyldiaminopimelate deacetylase n=1 Tax=Alicyclobacillus fastidiosus TaxID=392011 RepID=A0ABV5AFW8_9BACL|nr:N-acetyldiaminopimelate deacetylase [Alicyclobacillus fastidiosus]WEH12174.1 N-acetyldiaminopimelate deacetylase [Alicyclobacillus fastidiosus]
MDAARLTAVRHSLHRIPELGFEEHKTQAFLLSVIAELPQSHLKVTVWRTGVLVLVCGESPERRVAYRADMDGLPVREETGASYASVHDGMMHACGHDVHMTIALGLLAHFAVHRPKDDILFVFQPAEEGPGGALPMLQSDEFKNLRPDAIFALHVQPELPVGQIGLRPGILFANTSELFIDLIGRGGHAAFPHRANDMVIAGAQFIGAIQSIVSRNVDPLDSAVITIGRLEAGTKQNIIAERARIEGTMRALSADTMEQMKRRLESVLEGTAKMFDCTYELDYGANYHQVWNEERLTESFISFVEQQGLASVERVPTAMTGEDFGYFLREIPGFLFWLGAQSPYGLHHARMLPDQACVDVALKVLIPYFSERVYLQSL